MTQNIILMKGFTSQTHKLNPNLAHSFINLKEKTMNALTNNVFFSNFLGHAPNHYKLTIIGFLILNPIILQLFGPHITGWLIIAEFIYTLAMALKCYPLQPGGLIAIEAIALNLTSAETVYHEAVTNFPVILLLMFMVAGIYFMKDLLLFLFTKLLLNIRSKTFLSLLFCFVAAFLSAFLDALTVTAVLISVAVGFYTVYHKVASGIGVDEHDEHAEYHDVSNDEPIKAEHVKDLNEFRGFLRSLLMHGAVGTALGGVMTIVGEPQNLLIAKTAGWDFMKFLILMSPITVPVLIAGLITCVLLEKTKLFSYGMQIPQDVLQTLRDFNQEQQKHLTPSMVTKLIVQSVVALFLIVALALHIAEVGLIGLAVIVLLTAFNGVVEEHHLGKAFEEALPFTALLVVFFAIVGVIHSQHLFTPIIDWILNPNNVSHEYQSSIFFIANGVLSMISDNVFVATVYVNEIKNALAAGEITRYQFDHLAVAINTGTNIPSVATPNGQAAFLFLLTSALAPLIKLSYGRMVYMALPYTLVMSSVGLVCVYFFDAV